MPRGLSARYTARVTYETVISPEEAARHLHDTSWVFVDCRFDMRAPDQGHADYAARHVAGAVYAHLDRDLTGPILAGVTGRHPLPEPAALEQTLGWLGIGAGTQVVTYDASHGAMAASRLWWLLKWAGHEAVAVLDGGLRAWTEEGLPCGTGTESRPARKFNAAWRGELVLDAAQVLEIREDPAWVLLDARSGERFRGINETIDPVAGHIAGAGSSPYTDSLRPDETFRPISELAAMFAQRTGGRDPAHVAFYCGSGVTAAHAVLAAAYAGRGMARLYAGSWSEWITDPARPVAR